ncbi:hypothetical protein NN561_000832 [Cricetulus griseus]
MLRASCHWEGAESRGVTGKEKVDAVHAGSGQRVRRRDGTGRGGREEVTRLRSRVWAYAINSSLHVLVCEFAGALKTEKLFLVRSEATASVFLTSFCVYFLGCVDSCPTNGYGPEDGSGEKLARKDWEKITLFLTMVGA